MLQCAPSRQRLPVGAHSREHSTLLGMSVPDFCAYTRTQYYPHIVRRSRASLLQRGSPPARPSRPRSLWICDAYVPRLPRRAFISATPLPAIPPSSFHPTSPLQAISRADTPKSRPSLARWALNLDPAGDITLVRIVLASSRSNPRGGLLAPAHHITRAPPARLADV